MILTMRSIRVAVETVVSALAAVRDAREEHDSEGQGSRDDRG